MSGSPGASSHPRGPIHLLLHSAMLPGPLGWLKCMGEAEEAKAHVLPRSQVRSILRPQQHPPRPSPSPVCGWYAPVSLAGLQWMLLESTRRKEETQAGCGDPSGHPRFRDPFLQGRHHDPGKGRGMSPPPAPSSTLWTPTSLPSWESLLNHFKHPFLAPVQRSLWSFADVKRTKQPVSRNRLRTFPKPKALFPALPPTL